MATNSDTDKLTYVLAEHCLLAFVHRKPLPGWFTSMTREEQSAFLDANAHELFPLTDAERNEPSTCRLCLEILGNN